MRLLFLLLYIACWAALVGVFIVSTWEFVKAFDLNFSEAMASEHERELDVIRARAYPHTVLSLGLPLGLTVIAVMVYHLTVSFNAFTFGVAAVAWFISAPVRKYVEIRLAVRYYRLMMKLDAEGKMPLAYGLRGHKRFDIEQSAWKLTKRYYVRGATPPAKSLQPPSGSAACS